METPDVMAQYRLFTKYYNNAYENCDLADYQTADQLRRKVVPKIEDLFDGGAWLKSDVVRLFLGLVI